MAADIAISIIVVLIWALVIVTVIGMIVAAIKKMLR